jgi:hypothetical protein
MAKVSSPFPASHVSVAAPRSVARACHPFVTAATTKKDPSRPARHGFLQRMCTVGGLATNVALSCPRSCEYRRRGTMSGSARVITGHLQATGIDKAVRTQYPFQTHWREEPDREKHDRLLAGVPTACRRFVEPYAAMSVPESTPAGVRRRAPGSTLRFGAKQVSQCHASVPRSARGDWISAAVHVAPRRQGLSRSIRADRRLVARLDA